LYCGKLLTVKGVSEHERFHCRNNPNRRKRTFGKKKCKYCGKIFHAAGLRAHVATQHNLEFAQEKARRKPSSRAAQRRALAAKLSPAKQPPSKHSPKLHPKSPATAPREHTKQHHAPSTNGATDHAWSRMETKMSRAAAK
jgi:hypothetical protein